MFLFLYFLGFGSLASASGHLPDVRTNYSSSKFRQYCTISSLPPQGGILNFFWGAERTGLRPEPRERRVGSSEFCRYALGGRLRNAVPSGRVLLRRPPPAPRALLRANAPPTTLVRSKTSFGAHQSNKWCAPFSPVMRMTAQGGGLGRAGFRHRIYRESDSGKVLWA